MIPRFILKTSLPSIFIFTTRTSRRLQQQCRNATTALQWSFALKGGSCDSPRYWLASVDLVDI